MTTQPRTVKDALMHEYQQALAEWATLQVTGNEHAELSRTDEGQQRLSAIANRMRVLALREIPLVNEMIAAGWTEAEIANTKP